MPQLISPRFIKVGDNPTGYVLKVIGDTIDWAPAGFGGVLDSDKVIEITRNYLQNLNTRLLPRQGFELEIGGDSNRFSNFFVSDDGIYLGDGQIKQVEGDIVFVASDGKEIILKDFDSDLVLDIVDSDYVLERSPGFGPQGTCGIQGFVADSGFQGVQAIGIQGIQGIRGQRGIQGVQGFQGAQGIRGREFGTGPQGTQGIQGFQGTCGLQGVLGSFGTQGLSGTSFQGTQGTTGPIGPQGTAGSGYFSVTNTDTVINVPESQIIFGQNSIIANGKLLFISGFSKTKSAPGKFYLYEKVGSSFIFRNTFTGIASGFSNAGLSAAVTRDNSYFAMNIGANTTQGDFVGIWRQNSPGSWTQTQILTSSFNSGSDPEGFGREGTNPIAFSPSGELLIIGAPLDTVNTGTGGRVYVFKRNSAGTYQQIQRIVSPFQFSTFRFGQGIQISNDYVIIGDRANVNFFSYNDELGITSPWLSNIPNLGDVAGDKRFSLDVDNNRLAVVEAGAVGGDPAVNQVNIYRLKSPQETGEYETFGIARPTTTTGTPEIGSSDRRLQTAKILLRGDTLIAGAPNYDGSVENGGALYIFENVGETFWIEKEFIEHEPPGENAFFGRTFDLIDGVLAVSPGGGNDFIEDNRVLLYDFNPGALSGVSDTIQGLQGIQGIQEVQGVCGTQGVIGLQGPVGNRGTQGLTGFTRTDAQGAQGIQGFRGIQGPVGPQGDPGSCLDRSLDELCDVTLKCSLLVMGERASATGSNISSIFSSTETAGGVFISQRPICLSNANRSVSITTGITVAGGTCAYTIGMDQTVIGHYCNNSPANVDLTGIVAIGNQALATSEVPASRQGDLSYSIGIGDWAGKISNGCDNIFLGRFAGHKFNCRGDVVNASIGIGYSAFDNACCIGNANYAIGPRALAGTAIKDGLNIAVGHMAGCAYTTSSRTTAGRNIFIGACAGCGANNSCCNIAIGWGSGARLTNACDNIMIGEFAGCNTHSGCNNIILGAEAQASSSTATNQITLGSSQLVTLRSNVTSITALSDCRDKTDVKDLCFGINFVNSLRPVIFEWNHRDSNIMSGTKDIGFIAQELASVESDQQSAYLTRMTLLTDEDKLEADPLRTYPIAIKALKELAHELNELESEVDAWIGGQV